jgi:acetyl-CoA synthetase
MTVECIAIYLAVIQAGCVAVPIPDSFTTKEIAKRLTIAKAKLLFTKYIIHHGDKRLPLYERLIDSLDIPSIVLGNEHPRSGDLQWNEFLSNETSCDSVSRDPGDAATILFSSGTTGEPKAIVWNHTTPIKCAADGYFHQDIQPGDKVCWPTNLGWMMGPWLIFATLINRGVIALYQGSADRRFGEFIEAQQVNVLGVIPSLVRKWRDSACMEGLNWSSIKLFSSTGECSNAGDMAYLMSLANNCSVIEYCGGTEVGGGYLTSTVLAESIPATFTTPAMGNDFVLLDDAGNPTERGEAFLKGPSLGLSTQLINLDHYQTYFADSPEDELGRPLRRHGDLVERLPNGRFRVLGRSDDTMNIGGIKVGSAEIERVLCGIDGIVEAAAIGVSPTGGGPGQLVIYVVMMSGREHLLDATQRVMQQHIKEELNPLFKIHAVRAVAALPRTASHKVMRRSLKAMYEAEQKTVAVAMP